MIRAHKIRLNPTEEQETYLKKACGISRFAFNWGLARWKAAKDDRRRRFAANRPLKRSVWEWLYQT